MSETKLNLQQKMFAAIEGLVRETAVRSLDLSISVVVESPDFALTCETGELAFSVEAETKELQYALDAAITDGMDQLTRPVIKDAEIEALACGVLDEPVDMFHAPEILDEPVTFSAPVTDFFTRFRLESHLTYKTIVLTLPFSLPAPEIKSLNLSIFPIIKENTPLFRRLQVENPPAELMFIREAEQLYFWRLAVNKTRREAKKLKMLGVYPGVPRWAAENLKINYSTRNLTYSYNILADPAKKGGTLDCIAIFSDLENDKTIIVSKTP